MLQFDCTAQTYKIVQVPSFTAVSTDSIRRHFALSSYSYEK